MLTALMIIVDEDFGTPVYADPAPEDLEPEFWDRIREVVVEAYEGDRKPAGAEEIGTQVLAWKLFQRNGLSFIAMAEDVSSSEVQAYIRDLSSIYFDEVDDVRRPERDGVADVVVEVIPPWEE